MSEWDRLDKAQKVLNFAWGFGFLGMFSCLAGMALGIDPRGAMGVWLGLCFAAAVISLVGSIVTYAANAPDKS